MPRTSEITVTQRASTKLMKISQNFHENFTKISFENSLVPDEMYAFPYAQITQDHARGQTNARALA